MKPSVGVTTPSDFEIEVVRTFNAPARLVFDFHTQVKHVQKWQLGPDGWSMPICEIDLRVGGTYHYMWRNDGNGTEFGFHGEFREIVAPTRLVHTESPDGVEGEALCTLTFVERDGRTTLSTTMRFQSKEARDQALQSGMTDGMAVSYDRMEALMSPKAA